ncbi:MAG: ABC-2 family transporter protein [Candidatus Dojkabacteria bacterium]|nr:ABC-2 family transporter protein [Candidatus Dojkabacteria bacterium]
MKLIKIITTSIKQSLIYDMQYRTNLIVNAFATLGWTSISFITINIVGSKAEVISQTWTVDEYRLLWGTFYCSLLLVWFFFKWNIQYIPDKIVKGDLDYIIVKPFSSKVLASIGQVRIETTPTIIFAVYVVIRSLDNINPGFPFLELLLFLILIFFTALLFYSLFMIVITFSFWFLGAFNLSNLFVRISSFANYPVNIFGKFFTLFFFTVFPIAFISTIPAEAILELSIVKALLVIAVALIVSKLSSLFWRLGLKNYSSASS